MSQGSRQPPTERFSRAARLLVDRLVDRATGEQRRLSDDEIDRAVQSAAEQAGLEVEQLSYALRLEGPWRAYFRSELADATLGPPGTRGLESEGARLAGVPPADADVYYHNGVNALMGDHDHALACRSMQLVLATDGRSPGQEAGAHYFLGLALVGLGRADRARAELTAAVDLARRQGNEDAAELARAALAKL